MRTDSHAAEAQPALASEGAAPALAHASETPKSEPPNENPPAAPGALDQAVNLLSTHTSVINSLALRLIALEGHADALASRAARTFSAQPWRGALPAVAPATTFAPASSIRLLATDAVDGNTSLEELCLLMCLLKQTRAESIFEFGTFDGRTALNLAANCAPAGKIFTLDLPAAQARSTSLPLDQRDSLYIDKPSSGMRYRETAFRHKITQLHGDSASFDFSPYFKAIDFVFIDASHAYEYVLNDSCVALRLLREDEGIIAWHDYAPWWGGVVRALDELFTTEPRLAGLRHIEGTALAYAVVGQR
jgi:predicted O-methyltransferase YrrM